MGFLFLGLYLFNFENMKYEVYEENYLNSEATSVMIKHRKQEKNYDQLPS